MSSFCFPSLRFKVDANISGILKKLNIGNAIHNNFHRECVLLPWDISILLCMPVNGTGLKAEHNSLMNRKPTADSLPFSLAMIHAVKQFLSDGLSSWLCFPSHFCY